MNFSTKVDDSLSQSSNECLVSSRFTVLNVPLECLESIFGYLNMEELFSVSLANSDFVSSAALVFTRKYSGMTIKVHPHQIYAYKDENRLFECFKIDWVAPFNEFAFLRIFGKSIRKLHIVSYLGSEMVNATMSYIAQYCTQGFVTTEFILYSRWPTFRTKYQFIECLNDNSTRDLSNQLPPTLESLSLRCADCSFSGRNRYILEHLKQFSLMLPLTWSTLDPPPITFPNLKLLELRGIFMTEQWLQFIIQNQHLIKLDLISRSIGQWEQFPNHLLLELVANLPKLKVLALNESNIYLKSIPNFLSKCSTLKQLRLYASRWDCEKSFRAKFKAKILAKVERKWEIFAGAGRAVFIRKIDINTNKLKQQETSTADQQTEQKEEK